MTAAAVPLSDRLADRTRPLGRLCVVRAERRAALPLAGLKIRARVADRVAHVVTEQTFRNPYPEALEAVYIFPLPGGSAVSAFELRVGDRLIKGLVKERGEARATYDAALQQGKRAALLEQERDDVFTVQIGNLPPGQEVSVRLTTSERLPFFDDGSTELRLPLVVAPRYIPGQALPRDPVGDGVEFDTDQVPDASRITPPRLVPGFDPRVALSIEVELDEDRLADLCCSQHAVRHSSGAVALARQDELLDRDFVLRWRPAGESLATRLRITPDGFGLLSILPPRRDGFLGLARDVVFVLDRSGSMEGLKMSSAARACSLLLETLGPRDRFDVVAFDNSTEWLSGTAFTPADEAGRDAGHRFLRRIDARGGTELAPAMKETLQRFAQRADAAGRAAVVVVVTDGQVGNESDILKQVQADAADVRLFTLGIDTAVNQAFLKRLAALGGGTATFTEPGTKLDDALVAVGREIGTPLITDLAIEGAEDLAPGRVPDLFAGRAVSVLLRAKPGATLRIRGKGADGAPFAATVKARATELSSIAHLWARARIAELEDRARLEPARQADLVREIVTLSVKHQLLTRFTAFVVVDESEIANRGGQGRKVVQPVHTPALWEMQKEEAEAGGPPPAACMAAAPCPPPSLPASRKRKSVLASFFSPSEEADEAVAPPEPRATKAQEKALAAALAALRRALEAVRAELAAGRPPDLKAVERARDAVRKELASSPLGAELAGLQRALRTELAELLAAGPAAGLPLVERALKALEGAFAATSERRFWERKV